MKYLLVLIVGIALGIYVDRYQLRRPGDPGPVVVAPGTPVRDGVNDKMTQWRLTPEDIRQDLARTGEVVRTQASAVGEKISDARIITVVKAKYILDRDLSAAEIHVSVDQAHVTLVGKVDTPELVGRAVALALDTDGVIGVDSKLAVTRL